MIGSGQASGTGNRALQGQKAQLQGGLKRFAYLPIRASLIMRDNWFEMARPARTWAQFE